MIQTGCSARRRVATTTPQSHRRLLIKLAGVQEKHLGTANRKEALLSIRLPTAQALFMMVAWHLVLLKLMQSIHNFYGA